LRVYKVADIVNNEVLCCAAKGTGDLTSILTNLESASEPRPESTWKLEITIGQGRDARRHKLDLRPALSLADPVDAPIFIGDKQPLEQMGSSDDVYRLVFYRGRLFISERSPRTVDEREEVCLRVKKLVYDEEADLVSLRAAVANIEATIEYVKSGPRRDAIPEDVKLLVWARDGGACVRCGSKQDLHFDHVIPVSKGGGNLGVNIQILCQPCNLRKADKIAAS